MTTFAITVALLFLVGIPLIRKSVHLPAVMEFRDVPDAEWNDEQRLFFDGYDQQMRELGFTPFSTFAVVNMQNPNLTRAYRSEVDNTVAFLTAITAANGQSVSNYLEFVQEFADGTSLTTRNVEMSDVFPRMPARIRQDLRGATPAALRAAHESWVAREHKVAAGRADPRDLFRRISEKHTEWLLFLENAGYLRLDPSAPLYRATTKTALRGVFNFINPLADNFTLPRFVGGVVLGAALPLVVNLFESDILDALEPYVTPEYAPALVYAVAYGLSGMAVGRIFTKKAFLWAFLLAVVPVQAVLGSQAGSWLAEMWMALLAHYVSGLHMRRKSIAQPMQPVPSPEAL